MDDDQDQCRHHKGRDNDGYSLHRPRPKLSADDASTGILKHKPASEQFSGPSNEDRLYEHCSATA
jgi:hypothetical protein